MVGAQPIHTYYDVETFDRDRHKVYWERNVIQGKSTSYVYIVGRFGFSVSHVDCEYYIQWLDNTLCSLDL